MKVYVVLVNDHYDLDVDSVWSTLERAEERATERVGDVMDFELDEDSGDVHLAYHTTSERGPLLVDPDE